MRDCEHKWIFQEAQHKTRIYNSYPCHRVAFERKDVYFCEKCCETITKDYYERKTLSSAQLQNLKQHAPIWYTEENINAEFHRD